MKCPTLSELPSPPKGKTGWPWTKESQRMPEVRNDGSLWPKVSIMTPSFNQAGFIEETIRSVLLQGYPNIEYIVIDAESNDGSLEIIEKYKQWLYYWVSEPDKGQSDAINKGWAKSNGEIVAWINSDDYYESGIFKNIVTFFIENKSLDMLYGDCNIVDRDGQLIGTCPSVSYKLENLIRNKWFIAQPATFLRRKIIESIGAVNEKLNLVMDWEYFLRVALNGYRIQYFPELTANFRQWADAKTSSQSIRSAEEKIFVLKYLYSQSKYRSKIIRFKNMAFSDVYSWGSEANFKHSNVKGALIYLLKAVCYNPVLLLDWKITKRMLYYIRLLSGFIPDHSQKGTLI